MPKAQAEVEEEGGLRSRMYLHEALVEFIEANYDVDLSKVSPAEVIAWAFAKRNEFRGKDDPKQRKAYEGLLAERKKEAEAEKAERAALRAAAAKEKGDKAPAKATKKAPAKKATKKAAAPRKAAAKKGGAKAGATENPFD
jgi:hypothetical protein